MSLLLEFLEATRAARHDKKPRQRKPRKPKLKQHISSDLKAYVVFLRHGSLTEEDTPKNTFRQINQLTGIKITTCHRIV